MSCVLFVMARRRKWRVRKWIFGASLIGFSLLIAWGIFVTGYEWYRWSSPAWVFEATFHQMPPSEVVLLHGRYSHFVDSAGIDLAFRSRRETFDGLRHV